jgi:hypothetical protein
MLVQSGTGETAGWLELQKAVWRGWRASITPARPGIEEGGGKFIKGSLLVDTDSAWR